MNELISVIIPVYNVEKYVGNCIESLLKQTYKNIEIICVNDGSKDASGAVCESYSNKYDNVILVNQENSGVCAARNKGIDVAKGEYFCFVDSDDTMPEDAVEMLYLKIKKYSADIVVANANIGIGPNSQRKAFELIEDRVFEHGESIIKNAANSIFYSAWGKMFSKETMKNVRFIDGKRLNEDGFFVFQCMLNCKKLVQTNITVYNYIYYESSVSHSSFSDKCYDILYFRDEKYKLLKENYPNLSDLANAVYLKHSISFLDRLVRDGMKKHNAEIKKIVAEIRSHCKPLGYLSSRDRIKLFLIKNFISVYAKMIARGK